MSRHFFSKAGINGDDDIFLPFCSLLNQPFAEFKFLAHIFAPAIGITGNLFEMDILVAFCGLFN